MTDVPDPEKALRGELMTFGLALLEKVKKLDAPGLKESLERDTILENLKPQMDIFSALTKWYATATKGQTPEDGEGAAFHDFRNANRQREGANAGGTGGADAAKNNGGRRTVKPHRPKVSRAPRDIIEPIQ